MAKENIKKPAALGNLDLGDFSPQQNKALLDLFVLAMYMDGNLARVEAARVSQLLGAMGLASDYDRDREFDAAVTRIRRQPQTAEAGRITAAKLAKNFTTRGQQQGVYDLLGELTALDGSVSPEESRLLATLKEAFKL
jgi:hypothetical protein